MRDRVTPELRRFVLNRDGRCILARFDASHQCRDMWGRPHDSDDLDKLTIEHVKRHLAMSKRAPSDPQHCVALCGFRNVNRPPTKTEREYMRRYLAKLPPVENPHDAHVDPCGPTCRDQALDDMDAMAPGNFV